MTAPPPLSQGLDPALNHKVFILPFPSPRLCRLSAALAFLSSHTVKMERASLHNRPVLKHKHEARDTRERRKKEKGEDVAHIGQIAKQLAVIG